MRPELIILLAAVAVIWITVLILRVSSTAAFLAVLVGNILANELSFSGLNSPAFKIALLLAPLGLTILLLRGSVGKSKLFMEILPALATSIGLILFIYPLISPLRVGLEIATNDQIIDYRPWLLAGSGLVVLLSVLLNRSKHKDGKHH